jgi:hypothetical protein
MTSIYDTVKPYLDDMNKNGRTRSCAWEHCYAYFGQKHVTEHFACLHLSAYLPFFGMYNTQGSQPVQHEHIYLMPAIKVILANIQLRNVIITPTTKSSLLQSVLEIDTALQACFNEQVSDTLRTKIIMGTLGILPTYDSYVKAGLSHNNITQQFGAKSVGELFTFATDHAEEISMIQKFTKEARGMEYPVMRVLDMYFRETGKEEMLIFAHK